MFAADLPTLYPYVHDFTRHIVLTLCKEVKNICGWAWQWASAAVHVNTFLLKTTTLQNTQHMKNIYVHPVNFNVSQTKPNWGAI